ncbi:5-formyltetrahydrofolate cyclo-ligase [Maricaulaceae bacterium NA33B04]|nr:5-formyltetrahydrofolate cyclo-ligase [Maricaulaceae bacterium NA33B04]
MLTRWRKNRLRARARRARSAAFAAHPDACCALVSHFPDEIWPALHSVVAGYSPIGDEIDPTPLLETFHCEQARLALPMIEAKSEPLSFRAFSPGDELEAGAFGVKAPLAKTAVLKPSLVLVPLLAFDETGHRLGYGGGFYDRTLSALRKDGPVVAVGLAFEAQKVRRVPTGRHDQILDWVITDDNAYRMGADAK